jgi:hypothetical protein
MNRRSMITAALRGTLAASLLAAPTLPTWAQDNWPSKPVKIICPFPAGGTSDVMARLEKEIAALQAELADESLYARDLDRFAQAASELAKRRAELTAAEDRWLEIEALREEIERSP